MSNWFRHAGGDSAIAVSTRVRLARNISGFPFPSRISNEKAVDLIDAVTKPFIDNPVLSGAFNILRNPDLTAQRLGVLAEKHLVSRDFTKADRHRALIISRDSGASIMINEEDHLRIQVIGDGLCLEECLATAQKLDGIINEALQAHNMTYAYDRQKGFLTSCPTNLGCGLRASVMLHLPGLCAVGAMESMIASAGKLGMAVRGMYGEGTQPVGEMFQLSNQSSLGMSEDEICGKLKELVHSIIDGENRLRQQSMDDDNIKNVVIDRVSRADGLLKSAHMIDLPETMRLLSHLRLGRGIGILPGNPEELNALLHQVQPNTIANEHKEAKSEADISLLRAQILKKWLRN